RDGSRRVFAAPASMHFGSFIRWTDDFGKTWTNPEAVNVRFPEGSGSSLQRVWQIEVSGPEAANVRFPEGFGSSQEVRADVGRPQQRVWQIEVVAVERLRTLYCGVEPAALFESNDGGESWSLVRGLYDHPHREKWQPGGGGLCLHTIVSDGLANGRM